MYIVIILGGPVFVEQLSPLIRTVIKHDLLLRCQATSDELLDMAYIWTHNSMPIVGSNSEKIGHVVSINLIVIFILIMFDHENKICSNKIKIKHNLNVLVYLFIPVYSINKSIHNF